MRNKTRIFAVMVVVIFLSLGYILWQYFGPGNSWNSRSGDVAKERVVTEAENVNPNDVSYGKSLSGERLKIFDSGVNTESNSTEPSAWEKSTIAEDKIVWGENSFGKVANLRTLTTNVKSGEPIEFEILVKNVSDKDVFLPSGRGGEKMSACFWTFYFDQWEWRPAQLSCKNVPLKPGEIASVRCLVATVPGSIKAEQKGRFFHAPFRHLQNKKESDQLPPGSYQVRAMIGTIENGHGLESNSIEVRIIDHR